MLLPVLILVVLILVYLKFVFSARYCFKLPQVQPSYPLVGNIPSLWGHSSQSSFKFMCEAFGQTDRISRLMLGPVPLLLINHPDLMKQILLDPNMHDKPFFYDFMELGHGLITEKDGKRWHTDRKALNPTFNTRMLTSFLPIMDVRAKKMVSTLAPMADEAEFDILKYVGECTLEIVFSTTMGRNALELPGQKDYVKNLEVISAKVGERMINVNQFVDFFYHMTEDYKIGYVSRKICNDFVDTITPVDQIFLLKMESFEYLAAIQLLCILTMTTASLFKKFTAYCYIDYSLLFKTPNRRNRNVMEAIIAQRRNELQGENNNTQKGDDYEAKRLNFLDQILIILKDGATGFTDQEISDSLYTIMSAAHETSALSVAYTCLFLAMYPEIQTKVAAEMDAVFYDDSVEVTLDTLKQLEYTERVIKEVLRLCPAVPLGARQTGSEIILDGVRIPKGEILAFNWYAFHRRQDIWEPEPERFDPDRFLPEACLGRHPYAYLPFSGGLRNCIGHRYAMNSMRIMLLRILQSYEIGTSMKQSDMQHEFGVSLKLVGKHNVSLKKRNKLSM